MKNYCVICFDENGGHFNRLIAGVCRELNQPVCARHAAGCVQDGHGYDPLPKDGE